LLAISLRPGELVLDLRAMVVVDVKWWWRLLKSQSQLKFCFRHEGKVMPVLLCHMPNAIVLVSLSDEALM
jgi:hypothetical protein